jgi:hypothetical protein
MFGGPSKRFSFLSLSLLPHTSHSHFLIHTYSLLTTDNTNKNSVLQWLVIKSTTEGLAILACTTGVSVMRYIK